MKTFFSHPVCVLTVVLPFVLSVASPAADETDETAKKDSREASTSRSESADAQAEASKLDAVEMDAEAALKELKDMQSLLTALVLYSGDFGGVYPARLEDLGPDFIDQKDRERLLFWTLAPNRALPIHYVSGLDDAVRGSTPMIASPLLINGKRAVGYADGSARWVAQDKWEEQLAQALKDTPGAVLRTEL